MLLTGKKSLHKLYVTLLYTNSSQERVSHPYRIYPSLVLVGTMVQLNLWDNYHIYNLQKFKLQQDGNAGCNFDKRVINSLITIATDIYIHVAEYCGEHFRWLIMITFFFSFFREREREDIVWSELINPTDLFLTDRLNSIFLYSTAA